MLVILGIVVEIYDYRSSFIPGPTYESSAISGREVIGVGAGLLLLILGFYLLKEKKRSGVDESKFDPIHFLRH